jgi:hypothetical protein
VTCASVQDQASVATHLPLNVRCGSVTFRFSGLVSPAGHPGRPAGHVWTDLARSGPVRRRCYSRCYTSTAAYVREAEEGCGCGRR